MYNKKIKINEKNFQEKDLDTTTVEVVYNSEEYKIMKTRVPLTLSFMRCAPQINYDWLVTF